ncbi:hypothetical protein CEXT_466311 [Caerostris extrusa]|uniref:Uncharacterized protein n=1 Tax=Caerostris extrusa TaxID=172846 RepID=A0AAV4U8C2_CAEEX|nr:hypothetical protein CEXT_466311 [Caerostris extrusa]
MWQIQCYPGCYTIPYFYGTIFNEYSENELFQTRHFARSVWFAPNYLSQVKYGFILPVHNMDTKAFKLGCACLAFGTWFSCFRNHPPVYLSSD